MKKTTTFLLATMLAGAFTAASCSKTDNNANPDSTAMLADSVKQGDGLAKVMGLDTALHTITLAHNDIPGIMDAMTMEFTLEKPEMAAGLVAGDSVSFTLKEPATGTFIVSRIEKVH